MPQPRFHTPRNPARPSGGAQVAAIMRALGTPLMPWQQRAADVILELDPATGRYAYPTVVITVPRQAGKTTLVMALALHRALTDPGSKTWFTAQTGMAARTRFLQDLANPAVNAFGDKHLDLLKGAGDTRLTFRATGSQIRPHPPNDSYLHGEQSDLNLLDECWNFTEPQALALLQAIIPTQNTRPNAQTIYLSTMGDARSTWWHGLVDAARAGRPGTAIIDYGIGDDVDASDLEAVAAAHPAVGHTTTRAKLAEAAEGMEPNEYARGYGNRSTTTRKALLPAAVLDAVETLEQLPADAPLVIAAAVSWARDETVIVAAAMDGGVPVLEIMEQRPGTVWAADAIARFRDAQRPLAVVVDKVGPSAGLADELLLRGLELLPLTGRDVSTGTEDILDRMTHTDQDETLAPRIRYRRDAAFRRAWDNVAMRTVADIGRVFDRRRSAGSIAAAEASMLAVLALTHAPAPAPAPMIWTPK